MKHLTFMLIWRKKENTSRISFSVVSKWFFTQKRFILIQINLHLFEMLLTYAMFIKNDCITIQLSISYNFIVNAHSFSSNY